jgi:hypothetical protein
MSVKEDTERHIADLACRLDDYLATARGLRQAIHGLQETARVRIGTSRRLLAETEEMARGYKPTRR